MELRTGTTGGGHADAVGGDAVSAETSSDGRVAAAGGRGGGSGVEHLVSRGGLTGLAPFLPPSWASADDLLVATASTVGSSAVGSAADDGGADRSAEGNSGAPLSAPIVPPCGGARQILSPTEVSPGSATVGGASRDAIDEAEEFLIDDLDAPCTPAMTVPVGAFGSVVTTGDSGFLDGYLARTDSMVFTTDSPLVSCSLSQFAVVPPATCPGGGAGVLRSPAARTNGLCRAVATPGTPRQSGHRGASLSLPAVGMSPTLAALLESSALSATGRNPALVSMRSPALVSPGIGLVPSSDAGVTGAVLATDCGDEQSRTIANAMTAALARGVGEPGGGGRPRPPRLAPVTEAPRKRPRLATPTLRVGESGAAVAAVAGRDGRGGDAARPATVASVGVATAPPSPTEPATAPTELVSAAFPPPPPVLGSTAASGDDGDSLCGAATDASDDPDQSSSWEPFADRPVASASLASRPVTAAADRARHVIGSSATGSSAVAAGAAAAGTAAAASPPPAVSASPFTSALDESCQLIVTLSPSLPWNRRRSEWNWCESWAFPDVTARLITVGRGGMSADGAPPDGPLVAYLNVAVEGASHEEPLQSVGLVTSDGSTTDVQRLVLDRSGVARFSRLRLAITSAAFHSHRCRLVVRVGRAGAPPSEGVVLAAGGDSVVPDEAADLNPDSPGSVVVAMAMSVPFRVYSRRQTTERPCSRVKVDGGRGGSCIWGARPGSVLVSRVEGGGGSVGGGDGRAGLARTHASMPRGGPLQQPAPSSATSEQAPAARGDDGSDSGGAFPDGGRGVPSAPLMAVSASGAPALAAGAASATGSVLPPPAWGSPAHVVSMPMATVLGAAAPVTSGSLPPFVFGSSYLCTLPPPTGTAAVSGMGSTAEALPAVAAANLPSSFVVGAAPVVERTSSPSPVAPGATAAAAVPVWASAPPVAGSSGAGAVPADCAAVAAATAAGTLPALARARLFLKESLRLDAADRAAAAAVLAPRPVVDIAATAAAAFTSELTLLHDRTRAQLSALQSATCATVTGGVGNGGVDGGAVTAPPSSAGSGSTGSAWPAEMPESVRACFFSLKNELALYATLSSLLFKELTSRLPRVCESYEMDLAAHVALVRVAEGGNGSSGGSGGDGGGGKRLSSASALGGSGSFADVNAAGASADSTMSYRVGDHGSGSGGYDAAASFLASHRLATVVGSHLDKVAVHLLPLFKAHFTPIELALLARRLSAARSRGAKLLAIS